MATLPVDFTNFKPTSICNNNNVHIIFELTNNPKYETTCRYYHCKTGCRYGKLCYFSHMDFISILPKETLTNIIQTIKQNQEQKSSIPIINFQQTPTTIPYNIPPLKTYQQPHYNHINPQYKSTTTSYNTSPQQIPQQQENNIKILHKLIHDTNTKTNQTIANLRQEISKLKNIMTEANTNKSSNNNNNNNIKKKNQNLNNNKYKNHKNNNN
eukprot:364961_1